MVQIFESLLFVYPDHARQQTIFEVPLGVLLFFKLCHFDNQTCVVFAHAIVRVFFVQKLSFKGWVQLRIYFVAQNDFTVIITLQNLNLALTVEIPSKLIFVHFCDGVRCLGNFVLLLKYVS